MGKDAELPRPARRLIVATAALASLSIAIRLPELRLWNASDLWAFLALTSAAVLTEQFQLSLQRGSETENFSLTDALWVPGLVLAPPSVLVLSVLAGTVIGQALRGWAPRKIVFNASQFVVAITAAIAVFDAVGGDGHSDPHTMLAVVLSMTAFFAVNETLVALVIALVEGRPFRRVLVLPGGMNVLHWAGSVTLGLLGTAVWKMEPRALPLLVAPILLIYLAYRAWAQGRLTEEGMAEQRRMRALYEAGESLFGPLDLPSDFDNFLLHVRDAVGADGTELIVAEGGRITLHDPETPTAQLYRIGSNPLSDLVRPRPGLVTYAAPVGERERERGVLAVHREGAFTPAETSLVDALASQVAVKLDNRRLLHDAVEQRARLADIVTNSSDGIAVVASDGRVTSWNPAMARITGTEEHEALGRPWVEVLGSTEDWAGPVGVTGAETRDALIRRSDGAERWIRYTSSPIPDQDDGVSGYVVIARDATAELEAERMKSDFVAMVSHELRTPLTPLKGFLTLLATDESGISVEARTEYFQIMLRQANRLEALIGDLLDVSSIDAGKLGADVRRVELVSVLTEQIRESTEMHPGRRVQFAPRETSLQVVADPLRVRQVIANLLSNAFKHSPADSPVEVSLAVQARQAVVSVADQGEGIPLADRDRVFERFHRVESTTTRGGGGTGLGLYIARQLVEAMSGRLWLESELGQGTSLSFTLPLAEGRIELVRSDDDPSGDTRSEVG